MKVVHVITGDEGGGGKAAYRLNRGLNLLGCDSSMYVGSKLHPDPRTVVFKPPGDIAAKFRRLVYRTRDRIRARSPHDATWGWDHECQRGADPVKQLPEADLYNAHTLTNFLDYAAFWPAIPLKRPVVWTLHLMVAFTGGCSNSFGCDRFQQRCGACPMLHSHNERDLSRQVWNDKQAMYSRIPAERLHLVCPSNWLRGQLSRSSLLSRFPASAIPNALDIQAYAPRDKSFARRTLGLPADARVLLFVSQHSLAEKAKGFDLLMTMLAQMDRPRNLHLVTLGPDFPFQVDIPHRHLGHIFDDHVLSMIYSAADLFITPSLQDNFPNVVLEAIACGTPVVGFAIGGIPEIVRKGLTGEVVPAGDIRELRNAVEFLLREETVREQLSRSCREVAVREYSLEVQAARYLKIYTQMLGEPGPQVRGESPTAVNC
jgi:glycosyltransferase involved in cell wall biosynthesis